MPSIRHLCLSCTVFLAALPAQAAGQWSNDYVVPGNPPAPASGTQRWSDQLQLPSPATTPTPPPTPATAPATTPADQVSQANRAFEQLCRTGNRVEAKSAGQWYEARILSADARYQTCDVSYVGFGRHFDETVNLNRLRPYTGNVTPPPKPAAPRPGQAAPQGAPTGHVPICSSIPRSDGMGNTSYCY